MQKNNIYLYLPVNDAHFGQRHCLCFFVAE